MSRVRIDHVAATTFALLLAIFMGACESSNVYETEQARPNAVEFKSHISNPFLADKIDVTSVYVGDSDGLMRIQANITNSSDSNALFMYQYTWFDAQGLKLSTNDDHWSRRELNAGGKTEISAVSPTAKAKDWRLEIRPWDK